MSNLYDKSDAKTWRDAIAHEMSVRGDSWDQAEAVAATDDFLDSPFYFDYKPPRPAFTVWTVGFVYFATLYDGYVGVGSVPRNPTDARSLNENGCTQFKPDKRSDEGWASKE